MARISLRGSGKRREELIVERIQGLTRESHTNAQKRKREEDELGVEGKGGRKGEERWGDVEEFSWSWLVERLLVQLHFPFSTIQLF